MSDWELRIDDDYPGRVLRYRAHLWEDGKFRGDSYFSTKTGAKFWGWREKRRMTRPTYGKRTTVKL